MSLFGRQPKNKLLAFLSQVPSLDSNQIYSPEKFPVLGDETFTQSTTKSVDLRRQVPRSFPGPRLSIPEIVDRICKGKRVSSLCLTHRHKGARPLTEIRQEVVFAAREIFFYSASQIAKVLQISPSAVTRLQDRFHKKMIANSELEASLFHMLTQK
jgi:hypothetical protein